MSVCDSEIAANLRNKLLFINRRWKDVFDSVQEIEHDQIMQKKREEFYTARSGILETLEKIDREIQACLPCTTKALKEQETRLYVSARSTGGGGLRMRYARSLDLQKVQTGIDALNESIQALVKLAQSLGPENNGRDEMNAHLQICFDKLRQIREHLPMVLKRNKSMLAHLQKYDEDLQQCHQWFHDAEQQISRYTIQVSVKRVEEFLEQHQVSYIRTVH